MKRIPHLRLYAACLLLALLAASIVVQSMGLSLRSVLFIALVLGAGVVGFVAVVALLLRGKRAKSPT